MNGADDADLAWRVIEPAYDAVSVHDGPEVLATHLRGLTAGQRALLALHWCVSETRNGGFDQFFASPSGLLAQEARGAFELIGATEAAALLDQAVVVFASRPPEPDPEDPEFDEVDDADRFDAYCARYKPLERRFYTLVDTAIYPGAAAYVRAHPAEFVR